jgi:hypothetical protein
MYRAKARARNGAITTDNISNQSGETLAGRSI